MGQKVNPLGFRLGITKYWDSKWFAEKDYSNLIHEDIKLRGYFKKTLGQAGIAKIEIERPALKHVKINIHTARPGMIIGKKGAGIDGLKKDLQQLVKKEVFVNIKEVRKPDLDSQLVADNVALQLERRVAFRRAMKKAISQAIRLGAIGAKVSCHGRLGGAEMARAEWYIEGKMPLHKLRADIDYATSVANTTYGTIGIKVWLYKGDVQVRQVEEKAVNI